MMSLDSSHAASCGFASLGVWKTKQQSQAHTLVEQDSKVGLYCPFHMLLTWKELCAANSYFSLKAWKVKINHFSARIKQGWKCHCLPFRPVNHLLSLDIYHVTGLMDWQPRAFALLPWEQMETRKGPFVAGFIQICCLVCLILILGRHTVSVRSLHTLTVSTNLILGFLRSGATTQQTLFF